MREALAAGEDQVLRDLDADAVEAAVTVVTVVIVVTVGQVSVVALLFVDDVELVDVETDVFEVALTDIVLFVVLVLFVDVLLFVVPVIFVVELDVAQHPRLAVLDGGAPRAAHRGVHLAAPREPREPRQRRRAVHLARGGPRRYLATERDFHSGATNGRSVDIGGSHGSAL